MIDLLQITNDPALAARCDALPGVRIFIDLERHGKAERQAGRNTFISQHQLADIAPVKAVLKKNKLLVRVNPLHAATKIEADAVLAAGADMLMLPMFTAPAELAEFARIVNKRCPIVALLETRGALESLDAWVDTPGLWEVFVGLNDLHLSLGNGFMFQPLADGHVDRVSRVALAKGLRFGFGGIARLDEGLLPGRQVLGEHLRLGSQAVILSRTFRQAEGAGESLEAQIEALRLAEQLLARRTTEEVESNRRLVRELSAQIAEQLKANK